MTSVTKFVSVLFIVVLCSCTGKSQEGITGFEPEKADPFKEMPSNVSHVLQIAKNAEPGEKILVKGRIFESDGVTPAANVLMYFYHTDAKGVYAKRGNENRNSLAWWHGYNRGWLRTNNKGEYQIHTIKPAPYPARIEPAHIHCIVKAPSQNKTYPIGDIVFQGDELITEKYLYNVEQHGHPRDKGIVLKLNNEGVLEGQKDYVLYAQYDKLPKGYLSRFGLADKH